jgi:hypothetical protein
VPSGQDTGWFWKVALWKVSEEYLDGFNGEELCNKEQSTMTQWEKAGNLVKSKPPNTGVFFVFASLCLAPKQREISQETSICRQTKLPVNSHMNCLAGSTTTAPNKLLDMTTALANGLTAASSDVMKPNHPAKSLTFRNYSKEHVFIVFSCYVLVLLWNIRYTMHFLI